MEKLRNCSHETLTFLRKRAFLPQVPTFEYQKKGYSNWDHLFRPTTPQNGGVGVCHAFITFGWGLNQFWNLIILPCFYNVWFKFTFMFGPHFCIMYCTFSHFLKWIKSCSCSLLSLVHICAVGHVLFMFISLPSLFRLGVLGMGGGAADDIGRWPWIADATKACWQGGPLAQWPVATHFIW